MNRLRVLATLFVVAVAGLGIWVASTGMRSGATGGDPREGSASAYDFVVRDVVVQQMGPDGTLQYEMSAKQITQQPESGLITATELIMHRDPPGSPPGGPNRWTLRASQAELPEPGGTITLKGDVHATGRLERSRALISLASQELTYNLETQEVATTKQVDVTWGSNRFQSGNAYLNIKSEDIKVDSRLHATFDP